MRRGSAVAVAVLSAVLVAGGVAGCQVKTGGSSDAKGGSTATGRASGGEALQALEGLTVKPKGAMSGYSRDAFGPAWTDNVDDPYGHNHCDTRDDILARDLTKVSYKSGHCTVATGDLADPYTGKTIHFVRGPQSTKVQIDHVVPLGDAWVTGAAGWTATQRKQLAEDPLELLAADGPANEAKGDGDASEWLPANKSYDCSYVARQIAVKAKYHLWVTSAEKSAMEQTLAGCVDPKLPTEADST